MEMTRAIEIQFCSYVFLLDVLIVVTTSGRPMIHFVYIIIGNFSIFFLNLPQLIFSITLLTWYYILLSIGFARMGFSEQYHIEGKVWDARCGEKTISKQNISMIVCLSRIWHQYNVTLENSDNMSVSRLLLHNRYYCV